MRGGRIRAGGAAPGPDPSSSPRSVQFRIEIGPAGSRPAAGVTRRASLHETGISARVNGAVVGLTQKCRVRCAEAVRQWGCSSADAGSGPLLAPGAVVGLEQECSRRRGYQRQILEEAEDTLGMPASAGPPVRAGRPRGSPSLSRVAFDASGAGGTTPPPTGSSPGARAASLCSTAPGPRDTFSLIVNIPDRRRPARRRRSRDEDPRGGTDLEPELNRSRRGIRPISAKGRVGEAKERGRGETPAEHPGRLWADSPSDLPAPRRSRRNSRAPLPWEGD